MSYFSHIPLSGLIIGGFFTVTWGWVLWVGARGSKRPPRPRNHEPDLDAS